MQYLTSPVHQISLLLDAKDRLLIIQSQVYLLPCLAVLIPLSLIIRCSRPTSLPFIYTLVLSGILQIYVFQHISIYYQAGFLLAVITFFRGKRLVAIITVQSMMFIVIYHIEELIWNYSQWTLDASVIIIILIQKCCANLDANYYNQGSIYDYSRKKIRLKSNSNSYNSYDTPRNSSIFQRGSSSSLSSSSYSQPSSTRNSSYNPLTSKSKTGGKHHSNSQKRDARGRFCT